LAACAALFLQVYNNEPFNDAWSPEQSAKRLRDFFDTPGFLGVLAEEGGVLLGFALGNAEQWYPDRQFHLREICARPDRRRAGIGTALLEAMIEEMIKVNASVMYVNTGRRTNSERFFLDRGFLENEGSVQLFTRAPY
jgi:GNAT superfamily N-acetyltransferase